MISLSVKINKLDELRARAVKAPNTVLKYLAKATQAAIFEVEKQAVDRNFQFKWPRIARTGELEKSFKFGRYIHPSGLTASIGPTVNYAEAVYFGTYRTRPNFYMDRIARAAEPEVVKHFEKAAELIVNDIA